MKQTSDPMKSQNPDPNRCGKVRGAQAACPVLFLATSAALALAPATGQHAVAADAWEAHWIGPAESTPNLWTCYRKAFAADALPSSVPTRIAVDSKYWLWVNGELVVREGGLKRGPTPTGTYFDALDLAPHLCKGPNTLAVLVWHFGKNGFSHNSSGRAGLVFEADMGTHKIQSDASWRMRPHPAFGTAGGVQPNRRLPEASLRFDARLDEPGWVGNGFDDSSWSPALVAGTPPTAPWGRLEQRPIPFWKDYGLNDYVNAADLPAKSDGQVIVATLPYNAHVTPYLEIDAPAGLTIDMRTDNFMGGSEPNVHAEYITTDGVQTFEAYGWMNGHAVHYTVPSGVNVLSLKYRETGFNTEFTGTFRCNDPFFNTLWEKARRTLYVTMRDSYMDCPDRERAQWWGDAVNELGEVFYTFDTAGASLTQKGILELVRWQRSDHTLYSPVPSGRPADDSARRDQGGGNWNCELPPQMLASVGKYGFWTYYLYSGDRPTIAIAYPHVRDYLNIWKLDGDGLVVHRTGDWDWEDWGQDIDARILDSAWYHLALEGAVAMAAVCGHERDIPEWQARMRTIAGGFNKTFWTGQEYRSPGYKGDTDDRANAMAVISGLATTAQFPAIRKVLATHHNASPYMEKYVLEALYMMAAPEQALVRMKKRYRTQVASKLTTLWEGWGLGSEGYGGGTYNHAWSGGPLTVLEQYGAGIAPTTPAYATYHVLPQMGSLRQIETRVTTVRGEIQLALEQSDTAFHLELVSPTGTHAVVGIPQTAGRRVTRLAVNGKELHFRGQAKQAGIAYQGEDDRYCRFEVGPGTWRFDAYF